MPPRCKILFLAANPTDVPQRRLDEEARAIDQALRPAPHRDDFELVQHWSVRTRDLQELLLRHRPEVVHFSGQGGPAGEIVLQDVDSTARVAPPAALANLFKVLPDNVRLVVLNASGSAAQAEAMAEHVDCVVGLSGALDDEAAAGFSAALYRALAYREPVQIAFDLACNEVDLEGLAGADKPRLIALRADPATLILKPSPARPINSTQLRPYLQLAAGSRGP